MGAAGDDKGSTGPQCPDDFDSFFRKMFPKAVAVAERVTGERADAEDAALNALAKAHFRWSKIGAEPWRDAWVFKVTVNEAIRRLPKAHVFERAPHTEDPADDIVLRHALTAALQRLPRRQCEVIVLTYLLGFSETQVAAALGVTHGTVKTHLHRGMSALRRTVGPHLKEEHFVRLT